MNSPAVADGLIRLAPGVELVSGPNEVPLLYVSQRRTYVRLGEAAAHVIQWLDGRVVTGDEIATYLAARYHFDEHVDEPARRRLVAGFLQELDQAGALAHDGTEGAAPRTAWFRQAARRLMRQPRLRLLSWRVNRSVGQRPISSFRRRTGPVASLLVGLTAVLAAATVLYAAVGVGTVACPASVPLAFLAGAVLLHMTAHELSHALVASYHGVKTREFGLELLYFFIPMMYTDRTDSYRLADFRSRAAISLAGPIFDLCAAGASAAASILLAGSFSNERLLLSADLQLVMWMQLLICLANINPLLPTDGYHVLEAWFRSLNFRQRAFTLLVRRLTFRPLPPSLQGLRRGQQLRHLAFAVFSLAYILSFASVFAYQVVQHVYLAIRS